MTNAFETTAEAVAFFDYLYEHRTSRGLAASLAEILDLRRRAAAARAAAARAAAVRAAVDDDHRLSA